VVFLSDGTATSSDEMHRATLLNLGFGFADIVTCASWHQKAANLIRC
jgi:hypothetical protein